MMRKKLLLGVGLCSALFLIGCSDKSGDKPVTVDHVWRNGVNIFKTKEANIDPKCFYHSKQRPPFPMYPKDMAEHLVTQVVVFELDEKNNLIRLQPPAGFSDQVAGIFETGNKDQLDALINSFGDVPFRPYVLDEKELAIAPKISNTRLPNPLDINITWYSKLIFLTVDNTYTFDSKDPFTVVSGKPGYLSPFYDDIDVEFDGKAIRVNYQSNPNPKNEYEQIPNRNCVYEYELNLYNTYTDASGQRLQARIVIDPGGDNDGDGDPPPTFPPG